MDEIEGEREFLSYFFNCADIDRDSEGEEEFFLRVYLYGNGRVRLKECRTGNEIYLSLKEFQTANKIIQTLLEQ
jgi:hypothetical protein